MVAQSELGRRIPFAFLLELKKKFLAQYSPDDTDYQSLPAYGTAAFNSTLKSMLQQYNIAPPNDSLANAKKEIDSVKDIMTENIERVLERGERIDLLVDKTDRLGGSARDFPSQKSRPTQANVVEECQDHGFAGCGCGVLAVSVCGNWLWSARLVKMRGQISFSMGG